MPTYTFQNNDTGEIFERVMPMSELDSFKESNPHLSTIIQTSKFISGHNIKPDSGFREVLKNIQKNNRGANINTFE